MGSLLLSALGYGIGIVAGFASIIQFITGINDPKARKRAVVLAIITFFLFTGTYFVVNQVNQPSVPRPGPTPTPSPTASTTPTPTASPTPTPQVIQINQIMSCTNCATYDNFSLIVKYATFDPAQSQLTLVIGVKNISTDDKSEVQFEYLKLQDTQTGVTADGGGEGFSSFAISVNSQILFRPTFQFVPVTGHEYSLSAKLDSFDVGWAYHLFSRITIKF